MRYRQFTNSVPIGKLMPRIGDSIAIVKHEPSGRAVLKGRLLGFEKNRVLVYMANWNSPATFFVHTGDTLSHTEATIDGDTLLQHMRKGEIPYMTAMTIMNEQGTHRTYLDDMRGARQSLSKNGAVIGLAIGLAVDAALVIYALKNFTLFNEGTKF